MGGSCSTYRGGKRCTQDFVGITWGKDIIQTTLLIDYKHMYGVVRWWVPLFTFSDAGGSIPTTAPRRGGVKFALLISACTCVQRKETVSYAGLTVRKLRRERCWRLQETIYTNFKMCGTMSVCYDLKMAFSQFWLIIYLLLLLSSNFSLISFGWEIFTSHGMQ